MMLKMIRIDRSTSYTECNLINKIDRQILKWKFDISFNLNKLKGSSGVYYTHPECKIEHLTREDMTQCKIRTFNTFTESRYIDKITESSTEKSQ